MKLRKIISVMTLAGLLFLSTQGVYANESEMAAETLAWGTPIVSYQTHVEDLGWQDWVKDGEMSGTSGKALRLEGININVKNQDLGVMYRTHVEDLGWQDWKYNGDMSGTSGQAKKLEAIQIKPTGKQVSFYDFYYRVHAEELGWLGWAKSGEPAGTEGKALRLEGIEIIAVRKGDPAPNTGGAFESKYTEGQIRYQTHVEDLGWQNWVKDGEMSGTSGNALRLEGINISLNPGIDGEIEYRTHVEDLGWQNWVKNGEMSGTSGKALRLEGIEMKLTGNAAKSYDLMYRTHVEDLGWQNWVKNGEMSGTSGKALRLEGIEVKLVPATTNPEVPSEPEIHQHQWIDYSDKIDHEEIGHFEQKLVKEGYTEEVETWIEETWECCNICGADITLNLDEHIKNHTLNYEGGSWRTEYFKKVIEKITHPPIYENTWIVDQAAWTEIVKRTECSLCGLAK